MSFSLNSFVRLIASLINSFETLTVRPFDSNPTLSPGTILAGCVVTFSPLPRFTPDAPLAELLSISAPLSLPPALSSFAGASLALGIVAFSDLRSIPDASINSELLSGRNDERTLMTYLGARRLTSWKRTRSKTAIYIYCLHIASCKTRNHQHIPDLLWPGADYLLHVDLYYD